VGAGAAGWGLDYDLLRALAGGARRLPRALIPPALCPCGLAFAPSSDLGGHALDGNIPTEVGLMTQIFSL
jgi:hypothetical protein